MSGRLVHSWLLIQRAADSTSWRLITTHSLYVQLPSDLSCYPYRRLYPPRSLFSSLTVQSEQDFAEIAGAGLNWIRLPIPWWAIEVWDGEPFLPRTSWKYILRAFQWARKYGLRIMIDLHTAPGSQNGMSKLLRFYSPPPVGYPCPCNLIKPCRLQSLGKEKRYQLFAWPYGIRERPTDGQLHSNLHRIHCSARVCQRGPCIWHHQRGFGLGRWSRKRGIFVRCFFCYVRLYRA